ncbi:MSC_0624 family F1-like ATPase-associated membrane protein [Mycoplasma sp. E35C]|uniref:MSC_0624 family F1-like ATPase-associated membrane protein n=1 Tax=Mycoplasma sp. E35C TaxID=2801918 RepID=UPI001CA44FCA|nr:hypothetical protein [Mycoplasma sp. E35C]QZX49125.1 hypothetical protein JJE79_03675 [Mycoplasma sp. E35C]
MSDKKISLKLDKFKRLFKVQNNNTFYSLKSEVVSIKQNTKLVFLYRLIIFLVLFSFSISFILLVDRLFLVDYLKDYNKDSHRYLITNLFQFFNSTVTGINFYILLRLIGLYLVFISSLWWNYQNVSNINHRIKRYWIWFSLYMSLTLISGILLLGWVDKTPSISTVLGLVSLNVLLVILNYAYWLVGYFLNKKIQPVSKKDLTYILISYSFKLLAWIILFIFLDQLIKSGDQPDKTKLQETYIFNNNSVVNYIHSLTSGLSIDNAVLLFVYVTLTITLFILSNLYTILNLRLVFVKLINDDLKNKAYGAMSFCFIILITLIIGIIKLLAANEYPSNGLVNVETGVAENWFWIVGVLLFVAYGLIYFFLVRRHKTPVINNIYHSGSLLLMWALFLVSEFKKFNFNTSDNYISLLIISLITLFVSLIYIISANKQSAGLMIGFSITSIVIVASVFLIIFNNILLVNNNNELYSINSDLSINQILYALLIVVLSVNFIYVIISIYFIYLVINKNVFFKKKKNNINQNQTSDNNDLNNQPGAN